MTPGNFWEQFAPNALATFLGVIFGIGGAALVDWCRNKRKTKIGRQVVLTAYRHAIEANLHALDEIKRNLIPTRVVFYSLDLGLFDVLSDKALDVMDDLSFLQELNRFRYRLDQLARMLDTQRAHSFSPTPDRANWETLRTQLVTEIQKLVAALDGIGKDLLAKVVSRLAAL